MHRRGMTTWADATTAAPDLAADVRRRFEDVGMGFLATLRQDGSPRISGIELFFHDDEVWLGMMWDSRKALDLRRDPRCSVQAGSADKEVKAGDARLSGRGVEVDDEAVKARIGAAVAEVSEFDPNVHSPWHLFRLDVTELYFLRPEGDHLDLRWWTPEGGVRRHERR